MVVSCLDWAVTLTIADITFLLLAVHQVTSELEYLYFVPKY